MNGKFSANLTGKTEVFCAKAPRSALGTNRGIIVTEPSAAGLREPRRPISSASAQSP
jgi:hypothetical protein